MNNQQWMLAAILLLVASVTCAQTVEYIHTDALGSPVAVTNASGAVIERTVYEPYGAVINRPITNGPGYTGHVLDAVTGLNYMQQRYYDPALGRFLSNDPVTATSVGTNFNRYWYASNNPRRFVDPDGRFIQDKIYPPGDSPCGRLADVCLAAGDFFGAAEVDLGPDHVGRVDAVPNSDLYEVHVYKRGSALEDAVKNRNSKLLRKQEIGIVGPDGSWINKHGHSRAPTISMTTDNRIRSVVVQEARGRGWLGKQGAVNIKGANLGQAIRAGIERTGSLDHLKALGRSLGKAAVVTGYFENLSIERACSLDPDFEAGCP